MNRPFLAPTMTQILNLLTNGFCIQVSDRLLSRTFKPQEKSDRRIWTAPHDTNSNKSLVFLASDAFVIIGYCGIAYLEGDTTDTYIAKKLIGIDLLNDGSNKTNVPLSAVKLNDSIDALKTGLSESLRKLPIDRRRERLEITIAGWKWGSSSEDQVAFCQLVARDIETGDGSSLTIKSWEDSHPDALLLAPTPALPREEFERTVKQINKERVFSTNAREILNETLSNVAKLRPRAVSESSLEITAKPYIYKEYPLDTHLTFRFSHAGKGLRGDADVKAGYLPWIISPPFISWPQVVKQGSAMSTINFIGALRYNIITPESDVDGLIFSVESQDRQSEAAREESIEWLRRNKPDA